MREERERHHSHSQHTLTHSEKEIERERERARESEGGREKDRFRDKAYLGFSLCYSGEKVMHVLRPPYQIKSVLFNI